MNFYYKWFNIFFIANNESHLLLNQNIYIYILFKENNLIFAIT